MTDTKKPAATPVLPSASAAPKAEAPKAEAKAETPKTDTPKPKKAAEAPKKGEYSSAAVNLQKAVADIEKHMKLKPFNPPDTTMPHVSTGSSTIDILIGGSLAGDGKSALCPGFPRRRITEVYGPESSGKTTLSLSAAARLQKAGGSIMFIDFEHHLSKKYATDIGIKYDSPTFVVIQPRTFEEGIRMIMIAVGRGVDLVIVDSVAAMVPAAEMEKGSNDPMKVGAVAALMAKWLPRLGVLLDEYPKHEKKKIEGAPGTALVLLNQTRALIQTSGGGHGDAENTSGGKAVKFFASIRIRMSRIKSLSIKRKDPLSGREVTLQYGNITQVKMVKSKIDGKQNHTTQVFIRYGHGIDDHYSIIEAAITQKLVKKNGSRFELDGESFHGQDKLRKYLIANPKSFDGLKTKILNIALMGSKAIDPDEDLSEGDDLIEMLDKLGASEEGDDDEAEDLGMGGIEEEVLEDDGETPGGEELPN